MGRAVFSNKEGMRSLLMRSAELFLIFFIKKYLVECSFHGAKSKLCLGKDPPLFSAVLYGEKQKNATIEIGGRGRGFSLFFGLFDFASCALFLPFIQKKRDSSTPRIPFSLFLFFVGVVIHFNQTVALLLFGRGAGTAF